LRQQQEDDGQAEGEEQHQPTQLQRMLARDAIAHLAHDEVGLGMRRLECVHLAEVAEPGRGLGRVGAQLAVDAQPVGPT
jgi:hypothetical protein